MRPAPLTGLKVLELGTLIAGPFATRLMADFGADVVKIEPPNDGDPMRLWGTAVKGQRSLWWTVQSRGKKCITLNLRDPRGQQILKDLVKHFDIVVENFRPGTLEKWNLGYQELSRINPGLILVRVSGFGQTGPGKDRAGFGSVAEAMGGIRYVTGYPDRPPVRVGVALGDAVAAMFGVIGAMYAVYHRDVVGTGVGQVVDVALYEAVFALMESILPEYDKTGQIRERSGTILPGLAPSNTYETADGKWIVIGGNADTVFRRLAQAMGQTELAEDERFRDHLARGRHQEVLDNIISEWTRRHTENELLTILDAAGVPAGPIYSVADMVRDSHFIARQMIVEVDDKEWGPVKMPGLVPKLSESPGGIRWSGPDLGAHNAEVYSTLLGLSAEELRQLAADGVV
ncbi:MAG TPA: CoA transferase [Bacillota bacterium]|nr:CoA transferase [Bacillota bacterium]